MKLNLRPPCRINNFMLPLSLSLSLTLALLSRLLGLSLTHSFSTPIPHITSNSGSVRNPYDTYTCNACLTDFFPFRCRHVDLALIYRTRRCDITRWKFEITSWKRLCPSGTFRGKSSPEIRLMYQTQTDCCAADRKALRCSSKNGMQRNGRISRLYFTVV